MQQLCDLYLSKEEDEKAMMRREDRETKKRGRKKGRENQLAEVARESRSPMSVVVLLVEKRRRRGARVRASATSQGVLFVCVVRVFCACSWRGQRTTAGRRDRGNGGQEGRRKGRLGWKPAW